MPEFLTGLETGNLLTFFAACFVLVIVPGPTVTVIIANSLRHGAKAGLLNVAGTQIGLVPMVVIVALGLDTVIELMGQAFFWLKLAGAAYLVWLGIKLLRSDGSMGGGSVVDENGNAQNKAADPGWFHWVWQGMVVIWSNPKALFFFGAFIPQFVNPAYDAVPQALFYGFAFMVTGLVFDSMYAFLAGGARSVLTTARVRTLEIASGGLLIFGGIWMALSRR